MTSVLVARGYRRAFGVTGEMSGALLGGQYEYV